MKGLLLILSLIGLSACGRELTEQSSVAKVVQIDPELAPYVEMFEQDAKRLGKHITIDNLVVQFGDTGKDSYIAVCKVSSQTNPTIIFSTKFYNYYKKQGMFTDIEQVVFHELGHCVLGLNRNDTRDQKTDNPVSVMNTYHFSGDLYNEFRNNYLMQLFFNTTNNFQK